MSQPISFCPTRACLACLLGLFGVPLIAGCGGGIEDDGTGTVRNDRTVESSTATPADDTTQPPPMLDTTGAVLPDDISAASGLDITATATSTGGAGSGSDDFVECFGEESEAVNSGLDIFMIVDHTGSMGDDCPLDLVNGPPTDMQDPKWCYATHALAQYFMSPESEGNRVALQFMTVENEFANIASGADSYVCDAGENNPHGVAAVELTELPVDATNQLVTILDEDGPLVSPDLGTRIEAALRGMALYTTGHQAPDREMIGVLITDGDPAHCDTNVNNLGQIAADHLAATGIRTFIIGMTGATLRNLETIAVAGGADAHTEWCGDTQAAQGGGAMGGGAQLPDDGSCHYFNVGDGDPDAFVQALQDIQQAAVIPCEYAVPQAAPGEVLNPDKVNVLFVDEAGNETTFGRVADAVACAGGSGWYYDDPTSPSTIQLCESTCTTISTAATGARLKVSLGCDSVLQ